MQVVFASEQLAIEFVFLYIDLTEGGTELTAKLYSSVAGNSLFSCCSSIF